MLVCVGMLRVYYTTYVDDVAPLSLRTSSAGGALSLSNTAIGGVQDDWSRSLLSSLPLDVLSPRQNSQNLPEDD